MFKLDPITRKRFKKFKRIKRGYYSFIILTICILLSFFAELFINNRALLVKYNNSYFFPTYGDIIPGTTLGEDYEWEANYKELQRKYAEANEGNFVVLPLVAYNPFENDLKDDAHPPFPPSDDHPLGTDISGRDVLARVVYGFRIAILFSLALLLANYSIGITLGSFMGYIGGRFDIFMQRLIEIWSNIPFLYVIIIISSIVVPTFGMLVSIMILFGWPGMTWYMRTAAYKEKTRDYTLAARSIGCSNSRIIFKHILPNSISTIVTFIPFSIASGITSLTALDFLGFGLPAPTPSWGQLLQEGTDNLGSLWIVSSVVVCMVVILTMVTFVGEAIREAFDPKSHITYK